ncbi:perlucin-like protein [Patiria miniata]|uniref:C-type lectin domain-containing protein n=1 Tax=Patiria miniata TaxID=46514 RepID=A0A913ZZ31_PATMI|nr:perlucin-like protein [Patiria miniata]
MYSLKCFVVLAITYVITVLGSHICPSEPAVKCSCPPQWQLWQNGCYRLTPSLFSWDAAKEACKDMGGKMAAPCSLKEMNLMTEMAQKESREYRVWIACNDKRVEGTWECDGQEGGEPFLVWDNGQPDDDGGGNQDCAQIAARHHDRMDDDFCDRSHWVICVRKAQYTHLPTQPRQYCLSTDTHGRILNSTCLLDHNIREFITEGVAACGSACAKEPECRSFNIKKNEEGKKICQLNNSTSSEDKDNFQKTDYFCMYSEVCFG